MRVRTSTLIYAGVATVLFLFAAYRYLGSSGFFVRGSLPEPSDLSERVLSEAAEHELGPVAAPWYKDLAAIRRNKSWTSAEASLLERALSAGQTTRDHWIIACQALATANERLVRGFAIEEEARNRIVALMVGQLSAPDPQVRVCAINGVMSCGLADSNPALMSKVEAMAGDPDAEVSSMAKRSVKFRKERIAAQAKGR